MDTQQRTDTRTDAEAANRDPLTGAPGSHPVGTAVGASAGGIAAGAAVGAVAGPIGAAVGAAVGAVVGGLAGKGIAEKIDPTVENAYWRENYGSRDYVPSGSSFDDYGPAYAYGVDAFAGRDDRSSFDRAESDLSRDWESRRGSSSLSWDRAKPAVKDSWQRLSDRVERAIPGDSDRDGK
jgi:hypothetical protein